MGLEKLKKEVLEANLELVKRNLVISTWGNVSGYDEETGLMVIKASGVHYDDMRIEHMVAVNMEGKVVEGKYQPSTDTNTHIELYKAFKDKGIRGIVHTHSQYATMWAQLGKSIPCYGTTHCDYFFGDIPCTRLMTNEEIENDYEINTGKVILEEFVNRDCIEMQAVLVHSHAPFTWGKTPMDAVLHSQVLEYVSKMAIECSLMTDGKCDQVQKDLMLKHYNRKFGPDAYYGQEKR
jgi:L-ribulose-5-phosphate 4-epimerase